MWKFNDSDYVNSFVYRISTSGDENSHKTD